MKLIILQHLYTRFTSIDVLHLANVFSHTEIEVISITALQAVILSVPSLTYLDTAKLRHWGVKNQFYCTLGLGQKRHIIEG
jgi:hypothetical protein